MNISVSGLLFVTCFLCLYMLRGIIGDRRDNPHVRPFPAILAFALFAAFLAGIGGANLLCDHLAVRHIVRCSLCVLAVGYLVLGLATMGKDESLTILLFLLFLWSTGNAILHFLYAA